MGLVLPYDIESLRRLDVRYFMQPNDAMATIQCCGGKTDPNNIAKVRVDIAIRFQGQRSNAGCAQANKEPAVDQQVDCIADDLIDQGIYS